MVLVDLLAEKCSHLRDRNIQLIPVFGNCSACYNITPSRQNIRQLLVSIRALFVFLLNNFLNDGLNHLVTDHRSFLI